MRIFQRPVRRCMVVVALAIGALAACQPQPHLDLTVNTSADGADAAVGNGACEAHAGQGDCTLRAAIEEANAAASDDVVRVAPGVAPTVTGALPAIAGTLDLYGNGTTLHTHLGHTRGALILRDLTISDVSIPNGCGGAITSVGPSLSLSNVQVRDNSTAGNHGGGVCATGALTLLASSVTGNTVTGTAEASGGGIRSAGDLTLISSTVSANAVANGTVPSDQQADGISMVGSGGLTITGSTISSNSFRGDPYVQLSAPNAHGTVTRSTIDGSAKLSTAVTVSGSVIGPCAAGAPDSGGYNYLVGTGCSSVSTDLTGPTAPLLGLADNGGSTLTQLPIGRSPLLDVIPAGTAGLCDGSTNRDQRFLPRPADGGCDIGSVELQSAVRVGPITVIGASTPAGSQGQALAVNVGGKVVGNSWSFPTVLVNQPTSWEADGSRTDLGTLSATAGSGSASDINDSGVIVGTASTSSSGSHAFRRNPSTGVMVDLGTLPGDTSSQAAAINAAGTIVGSSSNRSGVTRAVMWDATTLDISELPRLGGSNSLATAVNDSGLAVGRSDQASGPVRAVRWNLGSGTVTDLGTVPGGTSSTALAINSSGTVVGTIGRPDLPDPCVEAGDSCPATRAFRWTQAQGMQSLPGDIGPYHGAGVAIDDRGYVLVSASTYDVYACSHCPNESHRAYIVDPVTNETILLGDSELTPSDISEQGKVVGTGIYAADAYSYFSVPLSTAITFLP